MSYRGMKENSTKRDAPSAKTGDDFPLARAPAGLARLWSAFFNSMRGLRDGVLTEAAIKHEVAIAILGVFLSFFIAVNVWTWIALVASTLLVLCVEFLNTSIERLCDHLHPARHEAIRVTKDLASAG